MRRLSMVFDVHISACTPIGSRRISNGCITLPSVSQFAKLRAFLKSQPMFDVPGTKLKAYGRVTVK